MNSGFRGKGACSRTASMYSPTPSSIIYYTKRHQIISIKCPAHLYENHQAYFTEVDMLKYSRAQLPDQVKFLAVKRWAQRAGLMPKAKGKSSAESAELPSSSSGFKARGGIGSMLYM